MADSLMQNDVNCVRQRESTWSYRNNWDLVCKRVHQLNEHSLAKLFLPRLPRHLHLLSIHQPELGMQYLKWTRFEQSPVRCESLCNRVTTIIVVYYVTSWQVIRNGFRYGNVKTYATSTDRSHSEHWGKHVV